MATLKDFGIRFISHGEWSDPEIEWEKSDFQTLLFNYWDVAECTDYETLDHTDENDLRELVAQLWELTPSEFARPKIDYEWEVDGYFDSDYYKDNKMPPKNDFVLHNTGQALRQALQYIWDNNLKDVNIQIYKNVGGKCSLVAWYDLQGSTLKDIMW